MVSSNTYLVSKVSNIYMIGILGTSILQLHSPNVFSSERLLEASINSRVDHNDNIFLTTEAHDSVTGIIITPSLSVVIKEENWEAKLNANLKINKYSDDTIDSNGQFFNLTGRYNAQRNSFSLNVSHDLDSNLNSISTDFGIAGRRIDRQSQSITPQYTRLLTERLLLSLSFTYSDVSYLDAENTNFIDSITKTGSASLQYELTEKNQLSFSLQAIDYERKDNLGEVQLFDLRIGVDHKFSEILSTDFQVGASRRNSTNRQTQIRDFFGRTALVRLEEEVKTNGLVLNVGLTQLLESGKVEGRISRDNTTNSFGGINQTDSFVVTYDEKLSSLWRYVVKARFDDITSITEGISTTDREVLFFEASVYYTFAHNWNTSASYRYIQREFKSDTSDGKTPHSNRIYVGLNYKFPALSTF